MIVDGWGIEPGANLSMAKLIKANLRDVNLSRVNVRGANLMGADLSGAKLARTFWGARTIFPEGFEIPVESLFTHYPLYIGEVRLSIRQAQSKLSRELERDPNLKEIAEAVDLSESIVKEILQSTRSTVSLGSPISDSSLDATISDLLPGEDQTLPEQELFGGSEKESLERVLSILSE